MKSREGSGGKSYSKKFKIAPHKEKKGCCHYIVWWGSFCLVFLWFLFLLYSYQSGLLLQVKGKLPTIDVADLNQKVNSAITLAEGQLLRGIQGGANLVNQQQQQQQPPAQMQPLVQQQQQPAQQQQQSNANSVAAAESGPGASLSAEYKVVPGGRKGDVHVIFSTDCTPFQDWQTLVLFHSALTVGQQGPVTRIASGCTEEQQKSLTALYEKLYPNHPFRAHYTPDWTKDSKTGKKYVFYNKPYGLEHWLDNAQPPVPDHTVVALLDPDMVFIRPITTQVRGLSNILHDRRVKPEDLPAVIERGHPVAQLYGLGAPWANDNHPKFNRTRVCGEGSPCLLEKQNYAEQHYAVGPPYIVEKGDIWRIARSWTDFVPRVYEKYPYLLAEMYAYSMGSAHEKLPHLQLEHYMVSNTDVDYGEGWPHVDVMDDVCAPPDSSGTFFPGKKTPTVLHYCQFFRAGELGFQKRRVPKDIFQCDKPMLAEPPADLGFTTYRVRNGVKEDLGKKQVKRNAFALCVAHRAINAALVHYKSIMCAPGEINSQKTINVQKIENCSGGCWAGGTPDASTPRTQAVTAQRMNKRYAVFASPVYADMAQKLETANPDKFRYHSIDWGKFPDGTDRINISGFQPKNMIAGEHCLFLASFHNNDVTLSQFTVFIVLLQSFIESLTIVLPYYPVGTMERVEVEGSVATANTYAMLFSSLPSCGRPLKLMLYDLHTLQNRFFFHGSCMPALRTAFPLFCKHVLHDSRHPITAVAFPDDGAAKRFRKAFSQTGLKEIICGKIRPADASRIVTVQSGDPQDEIVVIVDDLVQTGGTLNECALTLRAKGARSVTAFVPHAVFPNGSWAKFLRNSSPPGQWGTSFDKFWVTNSIPTTTTALPANDVFEVIDMLPQIAEDVDAC